MAQRAFRHMTQSSRGQSRSRADPASNQLTAGALVQFAVAPLLEERRKLRYVYFIHTFNWVVDHQPR